MPQKLGRHILKTIWQRKHDNTEGKMMGKATWGRKRMELLHDIMKGDIVDS